MKTNHSNFLKLAFNIAKINLGKTKTNPSVGCVIVKDNSVISSGYTSLNGRPHAEFNALKFKKNFKDSYLYVTMEPCTHYGLTPPCSNLILRKGIKHVFFSFNDLDSRTSKKFKQKCLKKKIKISKKMIFKYNDFYQSYFSIHKKSELFVDAKLALSKDYFTINKKTKWITNQSSRKRAHLIRSEYDAIISTSKSINNDNSILNCRLNGFDSKKPDLIVIDRNLNIKKNLEIFKNNTKRKIFIVTLKKDVKKNFYFKNKNIKFINMQNLTSRNDFIYLFSLIKNYGYNRVLIESGLTFLNKLLLNKLIYNLYIFQSLSKLKKKGKNNASNSFIKKLRLQKKIKVNLNNDSLYKIRIK